MSRHTLQHIYLPKDLNFDARTVAAANTVSSVFDVRGYSQFSLDLNLTRVAATGWTVFLEKSPDYHLQATKSNATWIRVQAESPGTISAGACTITLGDSTWSFTTSTNDTMSIELPINTSAMRFTVSNTSGSTDSATAIVTLGCNL